MFWKMCQLSVEKFGVGKIFLMVLSLMLKGCIYLIKNAVKNYKIVYNCFLCEYMLNCNLFL